jgi:hypothetical protein
MVGGNTIHLLQHKVRWVGAYGSAKTLQCMAVSIIRQAGFTYFYYLLCWNDGVFDSCVLKWFYDIFTGATIVATQCVSFIGNDFHLLIVSY